MSEPNHGVERFNMVSRGHPLEKTFKEVPSETGQWVHHSDYEKIEARAEEAEAEVERVRRHEVETAEAALKKVAQAKAQALAEVREALLSKEATAAAQNAIWSCGYKEGALPGKAAIEAALSTLEAKAAP